PPFHWTAQHSEQHRVRLEQLLGNPTFDLATAQAAGWEADLPGLAERQLAERTRRPAPPRRRAVPGMTAVRPPRRPARAISNFWRTQSPGMSSSRRPDSSLAPAQPRWIMASSTSAPATRSRRVI